MELVLAHAVVALGRDDDEPGRDLPGAEHHRLGHAGIGQHGLLELDRVDLLAVDEREPVVEPPDVLEAIGLGRVPHEQVARRVAAVRLVGDDLALPAVGDHALVGVAVLGPAQEGQQRLGRPQPVPLLVARRAVAGHELAHLGRAVVRDQVHAGADQQVAQVVRARGPAEHDDLEALEQLQALVGGQDLQRVRDAVEDLELGAQVLDDGRELAGAQRQVGIVEVDHLPRVERAQERGEAVIVEQGQGDEPPHAQVEAGVVDVVLVDVADRLGEACRAGRVQDVAGRARLELGVEVDAELLERSGLVVGAQQRGLHGPERVDCVDLVPVRLRMDELAAAGLLEQAHDGLLRG